VVKTYPPDLLHTVHVSLSEHSVQCRAGVGEFSNYPRTSIEMYILNPHSHKYIQAIAKKSRLSYFKRYTITNLERS